MYRIHVVQPMVADVKIVVMQTKGTFVRDKEQTFRSYFRLRWQRGVVVSGFRRMNEVNACRARLVLGWVTVFGRVHHLSM